MSSGFIIFLLLFVVLSSHGTNYYRRLKAYKKNKINGEIDMNELIKNYIDKECLIWLSWSSTITGTILEAADGWLEIQTKDSKQMVNCDMITRIQESPRKKNGKKKSVIF